MSVSGVPDNGIGYINIYYNTPSDKSSFYSSFDGKTGPSGIFPNTIGTFLGTFQVTSSVLPYWNTLFALWGNEPRLNGTAFTDTNGKAWPARPRPVTPVVSAPTWLTDQVLTFDKIISGASNSFYQGLVDATMSNGFKTIDVRLGWEDEIGTTPAGINGHTGSQFAAGPGLATAWDHYGGGSAGNRSPNTFAAWSPPYRKSFRMAKHVMQTYATSKYNGKVNGVWGVVFISYAGENGPLSQLDPDADLSDGLGFQVDTFGPDYYWGPIYNGNANFWTGYQNTSPFNTAFAATGVIPGTNGSKSWMDALTSDQGTMYHWSDFMDNHFTSGVGSGWSYWDLLQYMPNRANGAPIVPIQHPEYGLIGNNVDGSIFADPAQSGKFYTPWFAPCTRRTIAYLQSKGLLFRSMNIYSGSSTKQYQSYGSTWPELQGIGGYTLGDNSSPPPPPPPTTPTATIAALPNPLNIGSISIGGTYNGAVTSIQAIWSDTLPTSLTGFANMSLAGGNWTGNITVSVSGQPGSVWLALNGVLPTSAAAGGVPQTPVQPVDALTALPVPNGTVGSPFNASFSGNYTLPAVTGLQYSLVPHGTSAVWGALPIASTVAANGTWTVPLTYPGTGSYDLQFQDTVNSVISPVVSFTTATIVVPPTQIITIGPFTPLISTPFNIPFTVTVPVAGVSDLKFIATSGSAPFTFTQCTPSNCTISADGLTVTLTGIVNNVVAPHTLQLTQISTGISSPQIVYTPGGGTISPPVPPPPPTTETVTISYSDGTPSQTITKTIGVTATISYQALSNAVAVLSSDIPPTIDLRVILPPNVTLSISSNPQSQTDSIAWTDGSSPVISSGHTPGSTASVAISGDTGS